MTMPHEDAPGTPGWGPVPGGGQPGYPPPAWGQPEQPAGPGPQVPPAYGQPVPPPGYTQPAAPPGYPQPVPPPGYTQPLGPPGYPQPVPPPGYPQPGYGGVPGYGGAPGWQAPALQPGIVPLRPLGVWEILDGSFRAIRANPRVMFGLTAMVVAIVVALQAVVQWYVGGLLNGSLDDLLQSADPSGELKTGMGDQIGSSMASVLTAPFVSLATTLLTGLLIVSVSRSVIGQRISIGDVSRIARGRIWWVLGFTMLMGVAVSLVLGVVAGGAVLLARAHNWGAFAVVVIVGVLGLTVLAAWVAVRTLLVPAALMLEGAPFWTTIRRAWRLTRGSFWRLFGIYLLVQVIVSVVAGIVVYPVTILSMLVFQDPTMSSFGSIALTSLGEIVSLTLTTVYSAAVIALLYIDVRMRREGLDVELARAADKTAA